jgi:hypothetical protein
MSASIDGDDKQVNANHEREEMIFFYFLWGGGWGKTWFQVSGDVMIVPGERGS